MTNSDASTAPNAQRLLWAGFMAILASGVGFSVRGGILGQWADQFGFTMTELGTITGGGLAGFGLIIIIFSLCADKIGYGKLMALAFFLHFVSAVLTLATPWFFQSGGKEAAYWCLFSAMFIFATGNGVCEAVVNPLTANLFPKAQTHYLNILHAGWPAGLVLGSVASAFMAARTNDAGVVTSAAVDWKIQMSLFLLPVIVYGVMLLGQKFPRSNVAAAGVTFGQMIKSVLAPLMIILLIIHALVGYVELGTDSWISKITGSIMASPTKGLVLFAYTSLLMFVLRFFAGPIVHRISPIGLLFVSAVLGFIGLQLLGAATSVLLCVVAATIYALGKTFLWPTMLAVVSERFPKGGAIAIGLMGGIGMLSAGLIGGPAIGFKQDYYASENLQSKAPAAYERYKAENENSFAGFKTVGLDGAKVGILQDDGVDLGRAEEQLKKDGKTDENHAKLAAWWATSKDSAATDKPSVTEAGLVGGRSALKLTSFVPAVMAVFFLGLLIYFKAIGGYKALEITDEQASGGVKGPVA
jgi:MFS family permease